MIPELVLKALEEQESSSKLSSEFAGFVFRSSHRTVLADFMAKKVEELCRAWEEMKRILPDPQPGFVWDFQSTSFMDPRTCNLSITITPCLRGVNEPRKF